MKIACFAFVVVSTFNVALSQATCGNYAYQCPTPDERAIGGCTGCCCNFGYVGVAGSCNCQPAPPSTAPSASPSATYVYIPPAPTPTSTPQVCGPFAYQCASGDDRYVSSGCKAQCCCEYGFTAVSGTCGCQAASPSSVPSATPSATYVLVPTPSTTPAVCGPWSYQCGPTDYNHINSGCKTDCCCNYGYSPVSGTCGCQQPSPPPASTPTASPVSCGPWSYQCGAGSYNFLTTGCAASCCCNYGYKQVPGTCGCQAQSASPTPPPPASPSSAPATCGQGTYQCGVGAANYLSTGCAASCCCNYGYTQVPGTCTCQAATPSPTPAAAAQCGANTFQCGAGGLSGCGTASYGCCCYYGYTQVGGSCACAAATPSPSPVAVNAAAQCGYAGAKTFNCGGVGNPNQPLLTGVSSCSNCCCYWGTTQIAGQCACGTQAPVN